MTEAKIRALVIATAQEWYGAAEGSQWHKEIIDTYNSYLPHPRGYAMTYSAAWCAAFVSAVAIKCGLTEIMPVECSCSKLIELYKSRGRWKEDDGYIPEPGDLIVYDWGDSGKGDNVGAPDHVGIVCEAGCGRIIVIEGNLNASPKDKVGCREIPIDGKYIRGYCLPDYASVAEEEHSSASAPAVDPPEKYGKAITINLHQLSKGNKGEEVRALQALLILRGFGCGKSGADGSFGADTDKAVRAAQKHYELKVDGYAGKDTLAALWRG